MIAKYSAEGAQEARAHVERAIELDPEYGDVFTGVAHSYTQQVRFQTTGDRAVAPEHAIDAAKRAIELDPESSRPTTS